MDFNYLAACAWRNAEDKGFHAARKEMEEWRANAWAMVAQAHVGIAEAAEALRDVKNEEGFDRWIDQWMSDDSPESWEASAWKADYFCSLVLMATEIAEAAEEVQQAKDEEELVTKQTEDGKMNGFASELADVVIRVMDTAAEHGIDLADVIDRKNKYNATRPHMHGRGT